MKVESERAGGNAFTHKESVTTSTKSKLKVVRREGVVRVFRNNKWLVMSSKKPSEKGN